MYGYTPQQAAAAAAYGNYGTYSQNSYAQQPQAQNTGQMGTGAASTTYSSAGYSYPSAASAYAQYNQANNQQAQQSSATCGYGQQQPQLDYSTDYSSMFKSSGTAGYGTIGGRTTASTAPTNISAANASSIGGGLKQTSNCAATNHYAGYEAAVYAAASSYLQAKTTGQTNQWMTTNNKRGVGPGNKFQGGKYQASAGGGGAGFQKKRFGLGHQPREVQQFYCEVCKISCAGQGTYKEHLDGKAHKRKEALSKGENVQSLPRNKVSFRCDVCNVTCTGRDTYDAHAKGTKHQKTVALLKKMNKPIPTLEPTIIPPKDMPAGGVPIPTVGSAPTKKIVGVTGTKFVAGSKLSISGTDNSAQALLAESNVKPVGEEFIDEKRDSAGKLVEYSCKLCDCKFGDPNAKEIHLKGRRHRLQYKAKVNPELEVETKPNGPWGRKQQKRRSHAYPQPPLRPIVAPFGGSLFSGPAPESNDDRHVLAKCEAIQPSKTELENVETLVCMVEKTLKTISDKFAEEDTAASKSTEEETPVLETERLLKGVMRVGLLAKNLLLKTDTEIDLVVLCSKIPTETLLKKITELFPTFVQKDDSDTLNIVENIPESSIIISLSSIPLTCRVTLTCVALRDNDNLAAADGATATATAVEKPADALPVQPCLNALAELRHAKWFQVKCAQLSSSNVALKIVRDISSRVKTWMPLSTWAMELLTEKTLSSIQLQLSPGDAVRRIFEAIAGGVILNKNAALIDPCEKDPTDVLQNLTEQEREDITSSAQHALRLISFNQIYKIIATERLHDIRPPLVPPSQQQNGGDRKRLRESNGINADESSDAKKEKKEDAIKETA